MSRVIIVDLFAEDQAHEEVVGALARRAARERDLSVNLRIRRARGGHGRVLEELRLYQTSIKRGIAGLVLPDILVVAIDANCRRFAAARKEIEGALDASFRTLTAVACPEPHVERWCLADPPSFQKVIGITPRVPRRKCDRDFYKSLLSNSVIRAGHVPTLGGVEFADELVKAMDFYRAGKTERSLKAFLDELDSVLRPSMG